MYYTIVKYEYGRAQAFFFQRYICHRDSGGPTIWEDKKDKKRAYLLGIIKSSSADPNACESAMNNFYATIATKVPGKVLKWVKSFKYPEIEECLRPKKPSSLPKK